MQTVYQSHQTGIETWFLRRLYSLRNSINRTKPELKHEFGYRIVAAFDTINRTKPELKLMNVKRCLLFAKHYQSHQTGIETLVQFNGIRVAFTINRTKPELKRD